METKAPQIMLNGMAARNASTDLADQANTNGNNGDGGPGTLVSPNSSNLNMEDAGTGSDDVSFDAFPDIVLNQVMFLSDKDGVDKRQDERHAMVLTNG